MMMQILYYGGVPVAFDDKRPPDAHNPKGYFELEGGKIINRLIDGTFPMEKYEGKVIKITAYGIKFLPPGDYRIIYMLRDIEEVLRSMAKMSGDPSVFSEKELLLRLNRYILSLMDRRDDIEYITVDYNSVLREPEREIRRVMDFIGMSMDLDRAVGAVDPRIPEKEVKA